MSGTKEISPKPTDKEVYVVAEVRDGYCTSILPSTGFSSHEEAKAQASKNVLTRGGQYVVFKSCGGYTSKVTEWAADDLIHTFSEDDVLPF